MDVGFLLTKKQGVTVASKNITKELICKESLKIIKEEGLGKLSMRNLAARLGIKAPSLYVHIKNKADLIIMLQAYAFNANHLMGTLNPDDNSWQEYLLHIMHNMREFFLKNPYLFELFAAYESTSDESRTTFEKYLTKMQLYGFSLKNAAYIGRILRMFVIGHVEFEYKSAVSNRDHPQLPANIKPEFALIEEFFNKEGGYDHHQSFDFGIKLITKGCESLLP